MANAQQIENRLVPQAVQQPFGEIADVVLPEVPQGEDPGRDAGLRVGVTAVTEVLPQVFAVPEPLHKLCRAHGRVSTREGEHTGRERSSPGLATYPPPPLLPLPTPRSRLLGLCREHHTPPHSTWERSGGD